MRARATLRQKEDPLVINGKSPMIAVLAVHPLLLTPTISLETREADGACTKLTK
jgi:hypothetical protein